MQVLIIKLNNSSYFFTNFFKAKMKEPKPIIVINSFSSNCFLNIDFCCRGGVEEFPLSNLFLRNLIEANPMM